MLEINNLSVEAGDKLVLKDIDLDIHEGEAHVLFGPNGAGKSSLLKAILGDPGVEVISGEIIFKGKNIKDMPMHERVKLGIGIDFQHPPRVPGVKLGELLELIGDRDKGKVKEMAVTLDLDDFLDRDVNVGFSGGESKRSEILQVYAQNPDFIMFDEPDSGVDVESVELIGKKINKMLDKEKKPSERKKSGLIITHLGYILNFMDVDRAHVLYDGIIACSGRPKEIRDQIIENGYQGCIECCQMERS
ncbi:MAG: Cysteine desulfurase activator ATPase SufC [Candidatus Methanohalarchaeum thermophilum]|uniref:Cysteine desulfurase activator ATPase SufC n=1 Tax=Methanohalarchaeum thermophilum TaxID=1903181 RepID=A0A1Q6DTR1_METT1|nr:MAG: Cysteine desulfurase activator ATPase SufC [Candidatus Methanohalarchaeum thermophilum]